MTVTLDPAAAAQAARQADDHHRYGDAALEPDPWAEPEPEPDDSDPWPEDSDPFDPDRHAPQTSTNGHHPDGSDNEDDERATRFLIPAEFWNSHPVLAHIRTAAWSRNRCPDVVLHTVLARIASMCPAGVACDTGVGSPATVNYYAAPVGAPATGKTTGVAIGCDLIDVPPWLDMVDQLPLGSGEGVAEVYMGTVKEKDDRGKTTTVRKQVRHNAFFYVDEGEALTRTLERMGTTTGEAIRRGWSGAALGQRNATEERTRVIPKNSYSLGLVIGFQPTTIGALLADASAGTPQRFLYCWAADPNIPDVQPRWPGGIAWEPPQSVPPGGYGIDPAIRAEIHETDRARARGEHSVESLDAHDTLTKVKLALLLALLEQRTTIDTHDWARADLLWQTSRRVRDHLVARVKAEQEKRVRLSHEAAADRQITVLEKVDERAMAAAKRQAVGRVARHHETHAEKSCTRRCINQGIASKYKKLITIDGVLDRAIGEQLIRRVDGRFVPGKRAK